MNERILSGHFIKPPQKKYNLGTEKNYFEVMPLTNFPKATLEYFLDFFAIPWYRFNTESLSNVKFR